MGLVMSQLWELFGDWGTTEARILMLGLDAAGIYLFIYSFQSLI